MPAGTLTVYEITRTGLTATSIFTTPTATFGDDFDNTNGDVVIAVKNGSGDTITAQVTPTRTYRGVLPSAQSISVAAGAEKRFGPFPQGVFNTALGLANVLCSAVTDVTIAALRMVQP